MGTQKLRKVKVQPTKDGFKKVEALEEDFIGDEFDEFVEFDDVEERSVNHTHSAPPTTIYDQAFFDRLNAHMKDNYRGLNDQLD